MFYPLKYMQFLLLLLPFGVVAQSFTDGAAGKKKYTYYFRDSLELENCDSVCFSKHLSSITEFDSLGRTSKTVSYWKFPDYDTITRIYLYTYSEDTIFETHKTGTGEIIHEKIALQLELGRQELKTVEKGLISSGKYIPSKSFIVTEHQYNPTGFKTSEITYQQGGDTLSLYIYDTVIDSFSKSYTTKTTNFKKGTIVNESKTIFDTDWQLKSRLNKNLIGGKESEYFYSTKESPDKDALISVSVCIEDMDTSWIQESGFIFINNKRLYIFLEKTESASGEKYKNVYTRNEIGNITKETQFYLKDNSWRLTSAKDYYYDESNNCTSSVYRMFHNGKPNSISIEKYVYPPFIDK